ncbi:MerR family transcriptional regulator [Panacibacter microcysteis]|nr:MerR family transcriptional regulator [Panacibacter microcysteis]
MLQLDLFAAVAAPEETKSAEKKAVEAVVEDIKAEQHADAETAMVFVESEEPVATAQETVADTPRTAAGKRGRKSFKEMDADIVMVDVPADEVLFQKQYYAISEVAKWFHVNPSLLRYWEAEFTVLKPRKTRKGDRLFRPEDVKNLQLIYYLLRQRKFSIEGARQYMKDNRKKADAQMQLIQSLTKFRAFLLEWKANLGV